jgi:hypothetical protein
MTQMREQPATGPGAGGPPHGAEERPSGSGWTAGRVVGMVFSSIGALVGLALLLGGLALVGAHAFARDDDGYYTADREHLHSAAFAIATDDLDLDFGAGGWTPGDVLGTVRVRAESAGGDPIFLGIAPTSDVDRYLSGVGHSQLTDFAHGDPTYDVQPGRAPQGRPAAQHFWVAKTEGGGDQTVSWDVESGNWSAVVMNADGARGVSVDADAGVKIGWLLWVGLGLAIVGALLTAACVILVLRIGRSATQP